MTPGPSEDIRCHVWPYFFKTCKSPDQTLGHTQSGCQPGDCIWSLQFSSGVCVPSGAISEYVNPYIPTYTPEEYWSDHMQTPGWQPVLCVAWCLIWLFASLKKNIVVHDTKCPYWDQVSLNNTNQTKPNLRGLCGYIWVNILTVSPLRVNHCLELLVFAEYFFDLKDACMLWEVGYGMIQMPN